MPLVAVFLVLAVVAFLVSGCLYLAKAPHAPTFQAFGLALLAMAFLWPHFGLH